MLRFASNKYRLVAETTCWCFPRNQQQAVTLTRPSEEARTSAIAPRKIADSRASRIQDMGARLIQGSAPEGGSEPCRLRAGGLSWLFVLTLAKVSKAGVELLQLRDLLFPEGLRHTNKSHSSEAGHAAAIASSMTSQLEARHGQLAMREQNLLA